MMEKSLETTSVGTFSKTLFPTFQPVWPEKNRQKSIKVAQKCFYLKMVDFDTFTKIVKNARDLGKLIVAKDFKNLPKVQ